MTEAIDFNEERMVNEGGHEFEEFEEEKKESGEEQKDKDPDTHANPSELESSSGGNSPLYDTRSAEEKK